MATLRGIVEKSATGRRRSAWVAFALVLGFGAPVRAAERSNSTQSTGPAVDIHGSSTTQRASSQTASSAGFFDSVLGLPPFLSLSGMTRALGKPVERRPVGLRTVCGSSCVERGGAPSKSRVVTGAVISGVAAVGIGAGLVVLLTQGSRNEMPPAIPDLDVRLSGQKGGASLRWRF